MLFFPQCSSSGRFIICTYQSTMRRRKPFEDEHREEDAIRYYADNPSSFKILAAMVQDEEKLKRQQEIFEKQSDKRELAVFQAILACLCINPKDRLEMIEIEKLLSR